MKIATLNTWGTCGPYQNRWNYFLDQLKRFDPDILCLQEVIDSELTEKIQTILPLNFFSCAYEAGLLTLSRYPFKVQQILDYETVSLLEDHVRKAVIVTVQIGTKNITIGNTHLSWKKEDAHTRFKQVGELLKAIKQLKLPSILMGDFNDVWTSLAMQELQKEGYYNLIDFLHPNVRHITWDNMNHYIQSHAVRFPDRQIDYILFHESFLKTVRIQKCQVLFNKRSNDGFYASDHYGVGTEFDLA